MNPFALSFLVMLVCVVGEAFLYQKIKKRAAPWRDIVSNLNSGHVLLWVCRGLELLGFTLVLQHFSLHLVDQWHPFWVWTFAFVGWDFCFYWLHRMHHKFRFLWAIHEVHHEGEHFNLSLAIRNAWYSSLSSLPFMATLALLGVPVEVFLVVSSFHYSLQFYNHNSLVGKSGWLEKFLITPSHHRVHHGTDSRYIDRNFGGTFVIWDKLFGTFQAELDDVEMRYGVPGSVPTCNPVWVNLIPLFRYLKLPFPRQVQRRGWHVSNAIIATGGAILFGLVIYYVDREADLPRMQEFVLFSLIFLATIALGAMSDSSKWGGAAWIALTLLVPAVFIGYYGVVDIWSILLFSLFMLHGMSCIRLFGDSRVHRSGGKTEP